jgi:Leu/Phe-tRNA-protein transferase
MQNTTLNIDYLPLEYLQSPEILHEVIYPDMYRNYYWSDDFSARYYLSQAKAGFIAVTEQFEGRELLIPEIQYSYALLDFDDLHISKKVRRVISQRGLNIEISRNLDEVFEGINREHKQSWLTPNYLNTLYQTTFLFDEFDVISVMIRDNGRVIAGEIGYSIGATYTSLSGFSSKERIYRNYGTAQLVLLGRYLQQEGFAFWNLGQPYMDYKLALGAKIYSRGAFLERWEEAINL